MPGTVELTYDPELNIVFTEDHWDVSTKEEVDEFFKKYKVFFEKLGKKVYMISKIDGLRVHPKIAEYYGATARAQLYEYLLGFARYGSNDWARMTVRTTSLKAGMTPNIFDSREEAIKAIEEMKKTQKREGVDNKTAESAETDDTPDDQIQQDTQDNPSE